MKDSTDLKRRYQIVAALKSGWMKMPAVAKRAGMSRQGVRWIAQAEGITDAHINRAFEARQDKIWEEIKRKIREN